MQPCLESSGFVNGKSALDWVVERQCVKTDKASGIVNDANDWAIETMGKYGDVKYGDGPE